MSNAQYKPAQGKMLAMITEGGKIVCVFKVPPTDEQGRAMASAQSELAALREELAEVKSQSAEFGRAFNAQCRKTDSLQQRLADAERRNAEFIELLNLADHYLQDQFFNSAGEIVEPNSDDREEVRASIRNALTKPTESGVSEVAKRALSLENQRITPARFKCLACGEYHEGSGNLPCPKMRPMSGASE